MVVFLKKGKLGEPKLGYQVKEMPTTGSVPTLCDRSLLRILGEVSSASQLWYTTSLLQQEFENLQSEGFIFKLRADK